MTIDKVHTALLTTESNIEEATIKIKEISNTVYRWTNQMDMKLNKKKASKSA